MKYRGNLFGEGCDFLRQKWIANKCKYLEQVKWYFHMVMLWINNAIREKLNSFIPSVLEKLSFTCITQSSQTLRSKLWKDIFDNIYSVDNRAKIKLYMYP